MYPHHLHTQSDSRFFPEGVARIPHQGKQRIEVIFLKEEITHDIDAGIHLLEKGRDADSQPILDKDGKDDYLMARYIDTAINQAVARCRAYLLCPSPYVHRISTNHVGGWEEKSIYLAFPMNWPPHCIDPLRDAIHNYVVERAQQLFLAKVDAKLSEVCDIQATQYYNEINALLNTRLGGVHIQPTFLG